MTTEMEQNGDQVRIRMTAEYEQCMNELIGAALALDSGDTDEYDVLAKIMVRAGAAWRCCDCQGINRLKNRTCDNCGSKKPKARSIPEHNPWA